MNIRLDQETEREERRMLAEYYLDNSYIDPNTEVDYPPVAISKGESTYIKSNGETLTYPTPIATYGNFSVIQGPPKHKKTFLVTLLSAAYLSNSNRFTGDIKGHRGDKCLYHFDTEQGNFHAQRVFKRTLSMTKQTSACYKTFGLRPRTPEERCDIIEYALYNNENIGLCIIDGVADMINDVNNIEESNKVVSKLMKWSEETSTHIMVVIHSNHGSSKPTGHLGSALMKKCETLMLLSKGDDDDLVFVECALSRGVPFGKFCFKVNDFNLPYIVDDIWPKNKIGDLIK